jgi:hypothetical protein
MKKNKISFMRVLPEINNRSKKSSFFEYAVLHKKSYDLAVKNYAGSFKDALKQGKKYIHTTKIIKEYDEKVVGKVYDIYVSQMKRLNSFVFSVSFFKHFLESPSSMMFLIEYEEKIIAYSFCFEYKDNLYASVGGGNHNYFNLRPVNKLYDELVRYACGNNFNLHLGMGEKDAGFNLFKEKAGAVNYKCERFPDDEKVLKLFVPLLKLKIVGNILQYMSKKNPEKIIYMNMPFT